MHGTLKAPPLGLAALAAACVMAVAMLVAGCGGGTSATVPAPPDTKAPPSGLTWSTYQGVPTPFSRQGPMNVEDPVVTGYDHSPAGAAVAAIQATIRMSVAPDGQWPLVGRQMLAPGPGRDAWAVARAQISILDPVEEASAPQVIGYSVLGYGDTTTVAVFTRQRDSSLTRNTVTVLWRAGDWLLVVPDHPTTPLVSAVAAPPAGMIGLPR